MSGKGLSVDLFHLSHQVPKEATSHPIRNIPKTLDERAEKP